MSVQFQAENLRKEYGGRAVIDSISFSLREGRTLCVTGPNGSGKSTLMRLCAGLLFPDGGSTLLFVDGLRARITGKGNCAFASPDIRRYRDLTARENISLLYAPGSAESGRCESYCVRFGLDAYLDTRLAEYSSGMLQRFSLSMVFGSGAPLLLFDEPGSFLDEEGRDLFRTIFTEVSPSCIAMIATNDPVEAALCEKEVRLG